MKTPKVKGKKNKSKQLISKKERAEKRLENMRIISENKINVQLADVLISSKDFGNVSLKQKLTKELKKEKLGLKVDESLYIEREIEKEFHPAPAERKIAIYRPKRIVEDIQEENLPEVLINFVPPVLREATDEPYMPVMIPELDHVKLMGYQGREPMQIENDSDQNILPIIHMEQEIIEKIKEHNIVIICGETGSGKSTQLPRFLLENNLANKGRIGITQPRRVAAIALSQRVSQEMNLTLGKEIGYQVRYDSSTASSNNLIKFMTDGILLKEIASDFILSQYSVVIIDEAHERSVNTDILIGLLSRIVKLRHEKSEELGLDPLKLVIMSATLSVEEFTENKTLFETPPPVINIRTRQHPVTIHHTKVTNTEVFLELSLQKALKIHQNLPPGGILIFVPGKNDVLALVSLLKTRIPKTSSRILPLYSMLSLKNQLKIFKPQTDPLCRLIIVATNVAETSITIPNIVYVIDSGLEKQKLYSSNLQLSKFSIRPISQASALQRAGRAGRTCPGHCYRLYSSAAFSNTFSKFRQPLICQTPLSLIILQLKQIGIKNIFNFPFPTLPDTEHMNQALKHLVDLDALKQCRNGTGDIYELTELGREIAELPIAPRYGKMLILAKKFGVQAAMSVIVAAMEVEQIFESGSGKEKLAEGKKAHGKWFSGGSDWFVVYEMVKEAERQEDIEKFCSEQGVVQKSLEEVRKLSAQVLEMVEGNEKIEERREKNKLSREDREKIHKSIVAGFIDQIAVKKLLPNDKNISKRVPYECQKEIDFKMFSEEYKEKCGNLQNTYIHPSSFFFSRSPPEIIAYQHLLFITRPSMINITEVKPEWLYEFGGNLVQKIEIVKNCEPVYDCKADKLKTWVTATFGSKLWPLPEVFALYPEDDLKYFHFVKMLMQGKIFEGCGYNTKTWKIKINKSTDKYMTIMQKRLKQKRIDSGAKLAEAVRENNQFLLDIMSQVVKEEYMDLAKSFWKISGIL